MVFHQNTPDITKISNMKGSLQFQDFRLSTSSPSALGRAIDNPPKQFAGSKIPQRKAGKILAEVAYVDYTGKRHVIVCGSKSEILKARKWFDFFRDEHLAIRDLLSEYQSFGVIPKKWHATVRRELKLKFNIRKDRADWLIEHGC